MSAGLDRLQAALDAHEELADWPDDVCRDAYCGHWERLNGQYYWHTPADHDHCPAEATENQYPWRVGRKVGRTIYQQHGTEPSDADLLIGVMDSPEIAADAVTWHNEHGRRRFGRPHRFTATTQPLCQHHKWPNDSIDAICGQAKDHPIHRDPSPWLIAPPPPAADTEPGQGT